MFSFSLRFVFSYFAHFKVAEMEGTLDVCSLYSNLWFEGKATSIRNGDRYLYVAKHDVSKLPNVVEIGGCKAARLVSSSL